MLQKAPRGLKIPDGTQNGKTEPFRRNSRPRNRHRPLFLVEVIRRDLPHPLRPSGISSVSPTPNNDRHGTITCRSIYSALPRLQADDGPVRYRPHENRAQALTRPAIVSVTSSELGSISPTLSKRRATTRNSASSSTSSPRSPTDKPRPSTPSNGTGVSPSSSAIRLEQSIREYIDWIMGLIEVFKVKVRRKETQIQALSDDYVKFLRLADWNVLRAGVGAVGVITNNGYLDGHIFQDLRDHILRSYSSIRVLNLRETCLHKKERQPHI